MLKGVDMNVRLLAAEFIGTFVLVIAGPGSAVLATGGFAGPPSTIGVLGVSLAFGLSLLVMAYAVGPISGCHINPAVTVGMWLAKAIPSRDVPWYLIGQFVGGTFGALAILVIAKGAPGGFTPDDTNFAVNGWGQLSPGGFNFAAMAVTEIIMTAAFVFVVMSTTRKGFSPAGIGLSVGLALTLVHLISIPIDNTSVNPARSFAMAVFAGGDAIEQLWAFIVFPVIGGLLGAGIWVYLSREGSPVAEVRAD
jgi:aquaporin Z